MEREPPSDPTALVVTAGETMALLVPPVPGRLRHASTLSVRAGGAESNVAIGLVRLGVRARWVSALGDDEVGELVLGRVRAEGVDTVVRRVAGCPTGLYLREDVAGAVRVHYYRRGSAASTLAPGDVDESVLHGAQWLHLTGITPALSPGCAEFTRWLATLARDRGVRVSYDVNYRSKLWPAEDARAFADGLLPLVDVLFAGLDEVEVLWGLDDEDEALARLVAAGPPEVVLKLGAEGCVADLDGQRLRSPGFPMTVRDPIGAGDAFAAGYLAASVAGREPAARLRTANALGAFCVQGAGDYESLPSRRELDAFLSDVTDPGR